jgi:hypothetical protein
VIQVGDITRCLHDLHSESLYQVREIQDNIVTVMIIAPSERKFDVELDDLCKVDKTLAQARADWSRIHAYSGI